MKKILFLLMGVVLFLSGCATCSSTKYTTDVFKNYRVEKKGLLVQFDPIIDKEKSTWYLNLPPAKYDLLPVFISITNVSSFVKKVNVDASYLVDNSQKNQYESLSTEEAVQRLQSSGWVPTLFFGIPGSVAAGTSEKAKDDDIYRKSFKPRILNPSGNGEGVLFFKVPKEEILNNEFVLHLVVDDFNNNITEEVQISFETR